MLERRSSRLSPSATGAFVERQKHDEHPKHYRRIATNALATLAAALEAGNSAALTTYLTITARFHNYSWTNCLLIAMQRPDATHVAGFRAWLGFGRHVRKGEKGIAILAPIITKRKAEAGQQQEDSSIAEPANRLAHRPRAAPALANALSRS
jgi:hypothetical protein